MAKTIEQPTVQPTLRKQGPKPPPLGAKAVVGIFAVLSLLLAAISGYGYWFYTWSNGKLHGKGTVTTTPTGPISGTCVNNVCNVLLLGSDSRAGLSKSERTYFGSTATVGGHRSDTIMVLHVDPREDKAVVLSFPRDLWVNIPHQGWGKITSAYEGGAQRVAATITSISGLRISHLIAVNLAGFQGVVNALGGVPICVDRPMIDSLAQLDLPHAGCYNLNGFQALAFVRARHVQGDCIPDFARITRQQQFLRAVLTKILSKREIIHAPSLINKAFGNLTVDDKLTVADLIYDTQQLRGISSGDVIFRSVPGTPKTIPTAIGDQSVVIMDPVAKQIFARLREGKPIGQLGLVPVGTAPSPANVQIRVFDDHSGGKADKVKSLLQRAGFDVQPTLPWDKRVNVNGTSTLLTRWDSSLEKALGQVAHGFFPNTPQKGVSHHILHDIDAALVITSSYHGPGVSTATPGTNTQGAGAPGGPTC